MHTEKDSYLMLSISTPARSKRETLPRKPVIKHSPSDVLLIHVSTLLCIFLTAEEMGCLNQELNGSGRRKYTYSILQNLTQFLRRKQKDEMCMSVCMGLCVFGDKWRDREGYITEEETETKGRNNTEKLKNYSEPFLHFHLLLFSVYFVVLFWQIFRFKLHKYIIFTSNLQPKWAHPIVEKTVDGVIVCQY